MIRICSLFLCINFLVACSSFKVDERNFVSADSGPVLEFVIDENYLVAHTLLKMKARGKNSKTALNFQNYAWELDQKKYKKLKAYKNKKPHYLEDEKFKKEFNFYFKKLKESKEYKKLLRETEDYKLGCVKEWDKNYDKSLDLMRKITKLDFKFNKNIKVYITHPAVRNGSVWI